MSKIFEVSIRVGHAVMQHAVDEQLVNPMDEVQIKAALMAGMWERRYPNYELANR